MDNNDSSLPKVKLIGAPDDRGVHNVGGRLGAGEGPQAIRKALSQFMLGINGELEEICLFEGFDIPLGNSIEESHNALRLKITEDLKNGFFPIVLGGGHDYGFPHLAAATDNWGPNKVALINVDAHLDLRPTVNGVITSGSPFYMALETKALHADHFLEFGIQEHCNDKTFFDYAIEKGVHILPLDELRSLRGGATVCFEKWLKRFTAAGLHIIVSFDLDAVQMAFAPGVSAPQSDGFTPSEFLAMARMCGEHSSVASVGFFEFAPSLDMHGLTSRLAATAIHRTLCGFSRRNDQRIFRQRMKRLKARFQKR